MKLLSQESDKWVHRFAGGEWFSTREHRLHLVELDSEFSFNHFLPYIGTINSGEFGGVPAGRLLFSIRSTRDGETWNIVATLVEGEEHGNRPLSYIEPNSGKVLTITAPRYNERDFHDVLPQPAPFPNTDMLGFVDTWSLDHSSK